MSNQDFTSDFTVSQTPEEVFKAVTNVKAWWTTHLIGKSQHVDDEFEVRFDEVHYSKQKLTEVVPNEKVIWLVTDSKLTFIRNTSEWTGTTISFEISKHGDQTQLRFIHHGLVPKVECYDACSNAWSQYMKYSLWKLITTGVGQPGFPPEY